MRKKRSWLVTMVGSWVDNHFFEASLFCHEAMFSSRSDRRKNSDPFYINRFHIRGTGEGRDWGDWFNPSAALVPSIRVQCMKSCDAGSYLRFSEKSQRKFQREIRQRVLFGSSFLPFWRSQWDSLQSPVKVGLFSCFWERGTIHAAPFCGLVWQRALFFLSSIHWRILTDQSSHRFFLFQISEPWLGYVLNL